MSGTISTSSPLSWPVDRTLSPIKDLDTGKDVQSNDRVARGDVAIRGGPVVGNMVEAQAGTCTGLHTSIRPSPKPGRNVDPQEEKCALALPGPNLRPALGVEVEVEVEIG